MVFLAAEPDITAITTLINTWIHIGQALVGSIGALAFIFAFIWKITSVGALALANGKLVCITLIGRCRRRPVRNPSLSWPGVFARGPRPPYQYSLGTLVCAV
jgi:hypothetical protein